MWHSLPNIWKACFKLAWKSFSTGHVPVGTLIVDTNENILSTGYNGENVHINRRISHAEINAMLKLKDYDIKDIIIVSSLEPCVMCFSTLYMAMVRHIVFSCHDPHAGGCYLYKSSRYFSLRDICISHYENIVFERINVLLHLDYEVRTRKGISLQSTLSDWSRYYAWIESIDITEARMFLQNMMEYMSNGGIYENLYNNLSAFIVKY